MPSVSELYSQFGEICGLCSHFQPEQITAEMEDKIMEAIAVSSPEFYGAMLKDYLAIYGHCKLDKVGVLAGNDCAYRDDFGNSGFSLNIDGLNFEPRK